MRKPVKTILFVLLGIGVLCCGGGLVAAKIYTTKATESSITPETYNAVRIGQREDEVRRSLGGSSGLAKSALFGEEPAIPAGSRCAYALSRPTLSEMSQLVYRFCFADGKLVEKREIQGSGSEPTGN